MPFFVSWRHTTSGRAEPTMSRTESHLALLRLSPLTFQIRIFDMSIDINNTTKKGKATVSQKDIRRSRHHHNIMRDFVIFRWCPSNPNNAASARTWDWESGVSNRCMYFSKVASPMTAANPSRRTKLSCTCLTAPFGGPRPFFLSQTSAAPRHQIRRELLGTPLWNWRRQ